MIFIHPDGFIYRHPTSYESLRLYQLISSKYEGYPLHTITLGPAGTGKTFELEALNFKFNEEKGILEAANSTPKALVPSFKEKPASPGYILSCHRISLIDELMKMIENGSQVSRYSELMQNYLGQLNMLLEQKKRTIGSGNDNSISAQSTAKVVFCTNPIGTKTRLNEHLGIINPTTLSRCLIWVQGSEHVNWLLKHGKNKNIDESIYPLLEEGKGLLVSAMFLFLSIYDSCQSFLSNFEESKVKEVFKQSLNYLPNDLKNIWRARGLHHSILLLDGIVKERCLFVDYSIDFTAKDEDYVKLKEIVQSILATWQNDISMNFWEDKIE